MEKKNGRAVTVILYDARTNPPDRSGEYLYIETRRDNGTLAYVGNIPYSVKYGVWNMRDQRAPEDVERYGFEPRDEMDAFWAYIKDI